VKSVAILKPENATVGGIREYHLIRCEVEGKEEAISASLAEGENVGKAVGCILGATKA
jgi:hypothetical protein